MLRHRRLNQNWITGIRKPPLSMVIALGLAFLIIPALVFVLAFSYHRNRQASLKVLDRSIKRSQESSIEATKKLIDNPAGILHLLAEMAKVDPVQFRFELSREILYKGLISADQIDAIYVSFEDGYHRVVSRVDANRRRSDPSIPSAAKWHSSYVDPFVAGPSRRRHRSFFDHWPNKISGRSVPSDLDMRNLPHYQHSKSTGQLSITAPKINPDTGFPVISLGLPIIRGGNHIGMVGANITLDQLSSFLVQNRVSANSITLITDEVGSIVARPILESRINIHNGGHTSESIATLLHSDDRWLREAMRHRHETNKDSFVFMSSTGQELSASFLKFPPELEKPWQVVVITPIDDFIGELRRTNRLLIVVISSLLLVEFLLILPLSRGLAGGVEAVTLQLNAIRQLNFDENSRLSSSPIREIADLEAGLTLLRNSLQTFAQYVPLGIVQHLVASQQTLKPGVEPRAMTIFFADLEDFSSHAERMEPSELIQQISEYFAAVTDAITEEHGTVDKFIGDAVMAFWGAPLQCQDHAMKACMGALRAVRNMDALNSRWQTEGKPAWRMRIGLNTATVLVGNIGCSNRLSYTVMGDGVNVASRLEGKNKEYGTTICISDSVLQEVGDLVITRPLGATRVKGRRHEILIHELLGISHYDDSDFAAF